MRNVLDWLGKAAGLAVLGLGVWVILADKIVPELPNVAFSAVGGSPQAELAAMPAQTKIQQMAQLEVVRDIRTRTPPDAMFLVHVQNTFAYYAQRPFIRDVDPRMKEVYTAPDKQAAFQILRRFGVDYIYIPSWKTPSVENTHIRAILDDPNLATLAIDRFNHKIYRLNPSALQS